MQQFPELKDPQQNSMQKPHSAIIGKIVVSKYYFSIDLKYEFDAVSLIAGLVSQHSSLLVLLHALVQLFSSVMRIYCHILWSWPCYTQ